MDHLNNQEKKLLQDIKNKGMEEDTKDIEDTGEVNSGNSGNSSPGLEEQQTHNGIF